jgi:hypothetical protein
MVSRQQTLLPTRILGKRLYHDGLPGGKSAMHNRQYTEKCRYSFKESLFLREK